MKGKKQECPQCHKLIKGLKMHIRAAHQAVQDEPAGEHLLSEKISAEENIKESLNKDLSLIRAKYSLAKTQPQKPLEEAKRDDKNSLMLLLSGGLIFVGLITGWLWLTTTNMLVGVVAIGCCVGGYFMFRRYWGRRTEPSSVVVVGGAPVPQAQVNSLCLYPDRVDFENIEVPQGQPRRCRNDNKHYFVHIQDGETGGLRVFALSDQAYMDPIIFAQRVLDLPAHRRIFRRKETMLQKLQPMILVAAIAVVWILIITTTGD